jgi:hypothetical protein
MREIHHEPDVDSLLEGAVRTKQQLDTERWRKELRPRAIRLFAARAAKLTWSRALLKLVIEELYPDDLFRQLIGNFDRVPRRKWPRVLAIAVALRHSWRRDGLERIAKRLHISLRSGNTSTTSPHAIRVGRSPRTPPVKRGRKPKVVRR